MKKRVEAELISIAHRILKLKNKSEVDQLYTETQKLYEALSVLKFYQDNFELLKSEVTTDELEAKLEQALTTASTQETVVPTVEPVVEVAVAAEPLEAVADEEPMVPETEATAETTPEDTSDASSEDEEPVATEEPTFQPIFELAEDDEEEPVAPIVTDEKTDTKHVALEDLLGENYVDPVFVKPNEVSLFPTETTTEKPTETEIEKSKPAATLNNTFAKTIEIGLNDRIAFVNHLFGESNEDFNRVISQLNTFDTLEEAKNFLNEMVIPDYNYWVGKEDYMERFMAVVERKFS